MAFHLGFLWVAKQAGYRPDMVVGVSAGAIAGAAWAYDRLDVAIDLVKDLDEDHIHTKKSPIRLGLEFAMAKLGLAHYPMGLFKPKGLAELISGVLGQVSNPPICDFRAGRVNLATGAYESTISPNAPVMARQVLASATIPIFWPPVRIDGGAWVDGGVRNMASLSEPINEYGDQLGQILVLMTEQRAMRGGKSGNILEVASSSFTIAMKEALAADIDTFLDMNAMATELATRKEAALDVARNAINALALGDEEKATLLAAVAHAVSHTSHIKHPSKNRPILPYSLAVVEPVEDLGKGTDFSNGHFRELLRMGEDQGLALFKDRISPPNYVPIF